MSRALDRIDNVKRDPIHGNTVVRTVPCGVHPLHDVKVRASGARSGCPMCETQIEDLCRSMQSNPSMKTRMQ